MSWLWAKRPRARRLPTSLDQRLAKTGVGTLLAGTIGLLLVFAIIGIGLALSANEELTRERTVLLDQTGPALRAALRLEGALVNEETGVRGYVLTGDPSFLEPYRQGSSAETTAYLELSLREHALGEEISAMVAATRAQVSSWQRHFVSPAVGRLGRSPRRPLAIELEGKNLFDSVRASLSRLQNGLQRRDEQARMRLDSAANKLQAWLIFAAVLILGGLLSAGVLLRTAITSPLRRLGREARRVAGGEFSRPLDAIGGAREIVEVGSELDAMRERIVTELGIVQAAGEQLQEQADELKRSNAELEQFAYVASHDLQEPLRKVASFCQALQQRYGGQLDARADQYIEFAVDGAKRMQTLINDLLAFSRVGHGGLPQDHVALSEALDDARAALAGTIEQSGARIEAGKLPSVRGERTQLASLMQNLIGNAIKFRSAEPPLVRIDVECRDGAWELSCTDNGIGIDPQYSERIFMIFKRLHTRESYVGSGIGLALCRKIVEYHGGRMWLDPDYREGARFRFTLPTAKDADDES